MTPYYLYSNGKLKKVENPEPSYWQYHSRNPLKGEEDKAEYEFAQAAWINYVDRLPTIEVHPDLQAIWKEGEKYYEGKDFVIKKLTIHELLGGATTGCFSPCRTDTIEAGECSCWSKKDSAIPLPVESEESQDVLWNDVYMHLVREWMQTTYKGKVSNDFFAALKSKYHITKINE